jgi:hypothetical protein
MGFDCRKSEAHLLLLSKFIHANSLDDFARNDYWKSTWNNVLGEPLKQAIKRFVEEGILMAADLNDLLSYKYKVNQLKDMLKQRELPISGSKDMMIQRLTQADPEGMKNSVEELSIFKCSQRGLEIAEQHIAVEKEKRNSVERQVMEYLARRKYREASLAVAAYETEQVFPRGIGEDWKHHNPNHDIEMLVTIFESNLPKIIARLGDEKVEVVRIAAAMMALWGENKAKKWLPDDFEIDLSFDYDTIVRMINFQAVHRASLEQYHNEGLKHVEVLPASDSCESCKKLAHKHYKLDEVPELPNPNCTHKMGCRCTYLPVI